MLDTLNARPVNSSVMPLLDWGRMRIVIAIAMLFCGLTNTFAQSARIGAYQFQKSKGKHAASIIIRNAPFDSSKHKIGYDERTGKNLVDGRAAYGAEAVPRTQTKSIEFYFDRRRIKVPRWLYADCYNPNLEGEYVNVRFSRDLQSVLVTMWGADGAGAYGVVWVLRKNGKHTRYFKDAF